MAFVSGVTVFEEERTELKEIWEDIPPEARRAEGVKEDNFKIFTRTARKVGKNK